MMAPLACLGPRASRYLIACAVLGAGPALLGASADTPKFGLPAHCTLGEDCFVQQFADVLPGADVQDPYCGTAAYDGHDGIDLRILSMRDVARGVDVVAAADGTVERLRDGVPDHVMRTAEDRAAVRDKECGNGVVVRHETGLETQYCHLKQGSLVVKPGDHVTRGQKLGEIGASGAAAFPHVHFAVRNQGKTIEPITGEPLGEGCVADPHAADSLFQPGVLAAMGHGGPQFIAAGVAAGPVTETAMVDDGPPAPPDQNTPVVGWGWAINLAKGDVMTIRLLGPDGAVLAEQATPPMDHSKATYIAYSGLKHAPRPGAYTVETAVKRGEAIIAFKIGRTEIR